MHPLSGCLPTEYPTSQGLKTPLQACRCSICIRQPSSLQHLATQTVSSLRINIERFELSREVIVSIVKQSTRNESTLNAFHRRPIPKPYSSSGTAVARDTPPTPYVPPTAHGFPPQRDRSILRRKRSRLCIHLKTHFDVRFVTSRYFFL